MSEARTRGGKVFADLRDGSLIAQANWIGGDWVTLSDSSIAVDDPATGQTIANVPDVGAAGARRAIECASSALPAWRRTPAEARGAILSAWHGLILEHIEDLALILTCEQGKPLSEAAAELRYAASFLKWFAEEARRTDGRILAAAPPDRRILVTREPVGVCAAITPWNFPAAMVTRKIAPALAAGCTIIVKPSEFTPLTALALAVLGERAGVPAGVLNVITGDGAAIGRELTSNPTVRKLSFTGSTRVGALLMRQSANDVKRLSLELGGNAPFLVFDDADLDAAVEGALAAKFRNAGQACVAANRFLVQERVHDRFVRNLAGRIEGLAVGDGRAANIAIGPLINSAAAKKAGDLIADALAAGASVAAVAATSAGSANFVPPTLLVGVLPHMRISVEECFAPIAPVSMFDDEAAAILLANASPHGLAAFVYTSDAGRAWRVSEALEVGMVGLNTGSVSSEVAPFGGTGMSGFGREGGREGLGEYLTTKAVHWSGIHSAESRSGELF